jgi:hypothetical protein
VARHLFYLKAPDGKTLEVPFDVVVKRGGTAPGLEVSEDDCAALERVEWDNGGAIPLTPEEWRALVDGDTDTLLALAASEASNLHRLFSWNDRHAAELYRQRKLFGTGHIARRPTTSAGHCFSIARILRRAAGACGGSWFRAPPHVDWVGETLPAKFAVRWEPGFETTLLPTPQARPCRSHAGREPCRC